MKNQVYICNRKIRTYSAALLMTSALAFGASMAAAEDDMMGTMPPAQTPAPTMKDKSADAMAEDHKQMVKDHKKMMKKKPMKKKKMPMEMDSMEPDPDKPAEPMPAEPMKHM